MQGLTPPERSTSPPRRRRACIPCTNAKARCNFTDTDAGADDAVCESRVASLEERLDALTTAIETQNALTSRSLAIGGSSSSLGQAPAAQTASQSHTQRAQTASQSHTQSPVLPPISSPANSASAPPGPSPAAPPRQGSTSSSGWPSPQAPPLPPLGLTWPQAERILAIYRDTCLYNFPFVWIPGHMTAQELCESKPCLFRAVMLSSAPLPVARLKKMKRNVIAYISQHMLVEEERSLDVLQGLLIVIAWADLQSLYDQQITNLTYLATGYAHNLGITKIPRELLKQIGMDNAPDDVRAAKDINVPKAPSSDEMRAFLGVYYLLSINSSQFGRNTTMRCQYVDFCADALSQAGEYPSDFLLQQVVRLMQIEDRISEFFGSANDTARGRPFLFLVDENVTTLRAELDAVLESLSYAELTKRMPHCSPDQIDHFARYFELTRQYLLVRLYEPATYLGDMPDSGAPGGDSQQHQHHYRATALQNCLLAAGAFLDTVTSVPATSARFQALAAPGQTGFVMVICSRLLVVDAPGWDAAAARRALDFAGYLAKIVGRLEVAEERRRVNAEHFVRETRVLGVTPEEMAEPGRYAGSSQKTAYIKAWYENRLRQMDEAAAAGGAGPAATTLEPSEPMYVEETLLGRPWYRLSRNAGPRWFVGLLEGSAWNFDDVQMSNANQQPPE
ncbi:Fungal transcriptional regulatory protein [Cordyceps fumosorosea ARSEF 2679]|uniref:Fungal transcriptional regulatory protein n=1 Tax=Cordyceps fumosorosea (strain ARSEF 2679) TaxID=1081104 RepID=A0A167JTF7_CORFA|nr:Fungal transcriptional regulatory protein [Cordyceps fumosorosea ARSEF 2679]OAA50729.1 Fungal transcriptional regulatory protein [Cordyceps fumosorosea ARSEF 2679]